MIDPAPHALTIDQARALLQSGQAGDDFSVPDNARPDQHVHAKRVGPEGGKGSARVAVVMHGENPQAMLVSLIAAPQARTLAAALLNAADEVDGAVPLAYFPARFVAPEYLDDPAHETDEIVVDPDALGEPGAFGDLEIGQDEDEEGQA